MNKIFFVLIFIFSFSAQSYYSGYSSIQNDLDNIKRKQRCIEEQNREQREYSECLERCRQQEQRDRRMASLTGGPSISIGCYCSRPVSLGCY